jgi:hypothetical protein
MRQRGVTADHGKMPDALDPNAQGKSADREAKARTTCGGIFIYRIVKMCSSRHFANEVPVVKD